MNWVKENKFLTGFIIVMVIGLGILGYEVYSAGSAYDDAATKYTATAAEYNRLRHLGPFPNQQNLDQYDVQKKDAAQAITAFQVDLAKKEFPLTPLTPELFQDMLKASVTDVRKKADDAGVKLPDKFYLGFDKYETVPPTPEAAAPLGRQLKAIEWIVDQYIANRVILISSLARNELPEEKGGGQKGGGKSGKGGGGKPGKGGASGRRDLVRYDSFDITVICKQPRLQELLKAITGTQAPQFYVIRQLRIRNEKEKGPPKVTATPAPDATAPKAQVQYIVGEENIEVAARIDIVDFNAPSDASSVADKSNPAEK